MRNFIALVALGLLMAASSVQAADWYQGPGETGRVVTTPSPGQTIYISTAGAPSSLVSVRRCQRWTITVFGSGASVMPQACWSNADCATSGTNEDLIATALTGDTTNRFMSSIVPFQWIRLDTSSVVNVQLVCGW
jgi:hypothetical protein